MILTPDQAQDARVAGGKAAALSALVKAGFDVPDFIVIPATAFSMGKSGPTPKRGLATALTKALKPLGLGPFAVRSSGRSEDGAEHSHAGQFDTILNVAPKDVAKAAAQVWASGFGDTVGTYRKLTTGEAAEAPSIVVQQMIPARAAGVAFSADPLTGRRDRTVISAVEGLGDALVSGEVDGEDWAVDADSTITAPETAQVLTPDEATEIAALAAKAQAHFGTPQDIEWAYDGPRLVMLQSRAITTALRPEANADNTMIVFDNSNIVESYPGLVTPLTYSFAAYAYDRVYRAFVKLLGLPKGQIAANAPIFANLLGRVDGRVYYNLGNWYRALAMLPGFSLNRGYMEAMMGVAEPLPAELTDAIAPDHASTGRKAKDALRLGVVAGNLALQAARLQRTQRRFYDRLNHALNSGLDIERANLTQLAGEYRTIERDLLDRWDAPLINDFLCMIGFGASRAMLEKWAGEAGLAFHNEIMIGQGDIVSAEPVQRIASMAALVRAHGLTDALRENGAAAFGRNPTLKAEYDGYLEKFGDRCIAELKLESITLRDDPAPLVAAVLAGATRGEMAEQQHREPDYQALLPGRVKWRVARAFCGWASARVRDRENLRFERTRIFGYARQVFLAMGRELTALGHLDDPRDIFFLTVPEVLGAVEGSALSQDLAAPVAQRRAELEAAAQRPEPPERLIVRGPGIDVTKRLDQAQAAPVAEGNERQAKGCSAGRVKARARVIHDPRTEALEPGDILVARNTDPGWIAVFSNASAIVVERGSLLSHSAIVARELGIPCVVGLSDATQWITSGEMIEVDGATGLVRKCDE